MVSILAGMSNSVNPVYLPKRVVHKQQIQNEFIKKKLWGKMVSKQPLSIEQVELLDKKTMFLDLLPFLLLIFL